MKRNERAKPAVLLLVLGILAGGLAAACASTAGTGGAAAGSEAPKPAVTEAARPVSAPAPSAPEKSEAVQAYERGEALYYKMAFTEAIAEYTKAIELDPACAEAYMAMGNALGWEEESGERILGCYEKAAALDPAYTDFTLGYRLYLEEYQNHVNDFLPVYDHTNAIAAYDRAIADKVNLLEAYTDRANCYNKTGERGKALADYTEAIQLKPDFAGVYCNRAFVYFDAEQYEKMIRDCDEAIKLAPGYYVSYLLRGMANFKGDTEKALADFDRAIELNPDSKGPLAGMSYLMRSGVYLLRADWPHALRDISAAIEVNEINPTPDIMVTLFETRVEIYLKTEQYAEAIPDYTKLIALKPEWFVYYLRRGYCRFLTGEYDKAMEDVEVCLKDDPQWEDALELKKEIEAGRAAGSE